MGAFRRPFLGLFGGKTKAPKIAPPPSREDEEMKAAARREAEVLRRKKGMASMNVTGPGGVTGEPTTRKALLGE